MMSTFVHTKPGWGRNARLYSTLTAVMATAAIALTGCSNNSDMYIEGYWDNGDPLYSPVKALLFDTENNPKCETPITHNRVETRYRSYSATGGVANAFLFEVANPETDPATAKDDATRRKLERLQNSLEAMYQLTHPEFDAKYKISAPEDMGPIKAELREKLPNLLEFPLQNYVSIGDQWLVSDLGEFKLGRLGDVEAYIDNMKIDHKFNGLRNDYLRANGNGEEYLYVRSRSSGEIQLMLAGSEPLVLENASMFSQLNVTDNADRPDLVSVKLTLANDGCSSDGKTNFARWWVWDYETLDPVDEGIIED